MLSETSAGQRARDTIVRGLKAALAAHHERRVLDIGDGWDDASAVDSHDSRVSIALNLWEEWAYAAGHGWRSFYGGIAKDDWPRLANVVIDSLEHDRQIVDSEILERFVRQPRPPGILSRLIEKLRALR